MHLTTFCLYLALALLLPCGIIELAFISSMVSWLHRRAGTYFEFYYYWQDPVYPDLNTIGPGVIAGRPAKLQVNQGHVSNGAAGFAVVLVCLFGCALLTLRHFKPTTFRKTASIALYNVWLVFTMVSALLALTALIFTFTLTTDFADQHIDMRIAFNGVCPEDFIGQCDQRKPYEVNTWTPEIWCQALLRDANLTRNSDIEDITNQLALMRGWRWNLIPLFILGSAVAGLAWYEAFRRKGEVRGTARYQPAPKA